MRMKIMISVLFGAVFVANILQAFYYPATDGCVRIGERQRPQNEDNNCVRIGNPYGDSILIFQ